MALAIFYEFLSFFLLFRASIIWVLWMVLNHAQLESRVQHKLFDVDPDYSLLIVFGCACAQYRTVHPYNVIYLTKYTVPCHLKFWVSQQLYMRVQADSGKK